MRFPDLFPRRLIYGLGRSFPSLLPAFLPNQFLFPVPRRVIMIMDCFEVMMVLMSAMDVIYAAIEWLIE